MRARFAGPNAGSEQDREAASAASRPVRIAREEELLAELGGDADGHEQTYRLLVGVLLRDPGELESLRAETISPLLSYDSEHGTELVTTLREFLLRDGSTTETAEQMQLHRHTVGYRLARVLEVSGLSPYESDGRERLSLGLKADQILAANERLSKHERLAPARHPPGGTEGDNHHR
jgi:DNA-binding PucR family transcriptional regulator